MTQDYNGQVVWIIGASSGIGLALAKTLHARGATLVLSARRADKLEGLKNALDGMPQIFPLDITNAAAVSDTVKEIQTRLGRLDRVIFLAASYTPTTLLDLDLQTAKQMIDTNLLGAFHVVHALLPVFKAQKTPSQLAICGSVAGFTGLPGGQPYSATKAAIINLAESLYAECQDFCDIKLINPGFVKTELTDKNTFKMPLMISPEQAADAIADGLLKNAFEIHFPKAFTLWLKLIRLLPYSLSLPLLRRIKP